MPKTQLIYPNGEKKNLDKKHPTLYYTNLLRGYLVQRFNN